MKKKVMTFILATTLVASMSMTALADDEKTGAADLELTQGTFTILEDTLIPSLPEAYHNIGDLSIDFGPNTITGLEQTITKGKVGVIVQDARGGEESTWHVTARLGEFENEDEKTTLVGAQLKFAAVANSVAPTTAPAGAGKPTHVNANMTAGAATGSLVFHSAAVDTEQNIKGSGGTWGANWTPSLVVPSNAEVGVHSAYIYWTLTAGPV